MFESFSLMMLGISKSGTWVEVKLLQHPVPSVWAGWRSVSWNVCLCVYIYIYIYMYTCVWLCTCMCAYIHAHTHLFPTYVSQWTPSTHGLSSSHPGPPGPSDSHLRQVPHSQRHMHMWLPGNLPCVPVSPAWCLLGVTQQLSLWLLAPWTHGSQWPAILLQLLHSQTHMHTCLQQSGNHTYRKG